MIIESHRFISTLAVAIWLVSACAPPVESGFFAPGKADSVSTAVAPEVVHPSAGFAPQLAFDAAGRAAAAFISESSLVYAIRVAAPTAKSAPSTGGAAWQTIVVAAPWRSGVVDARQHPAYADNPALALDAAGQPHALYCGKGANGNQVLYAHCKGTLAVDCLDAQRWSRAVVATRADDCIGFRGDLVVDAAGVPHAVWHGRDGVWYAKRGTGGGWEPLVVDADGAFPALALDGSDRPHLCYRLDSASLRWSAAYARMTDAGFSSPTVLDWAGGCDESGCERCTASGSCAYRDEQGITYDTWGSDCSIAVDAAGNPHVSYFGGDGYTDGAGAAAADGTNYRLRYTAFDGQGWSTPLEVDGGVGQPSVGRGATLALGSGGALHLAYHREAGALEHASCSSGASCQSDANAWLVTTVAADAVRASSAMALGAGDEPHFVYGVREPARLLFSGAAAAKAP